MVVIDEGRPFMIGKRYENPFNTFHYLYAGALILASYREGWFAEDKITWPEALFIDLLIIALAV